MELSETNVQIRDCSIDFIPVYVKKEDEIREKNHNDAEIITTARHFCAIEINENKEYNTIKEGKELNVNSKNCEENTSDLNTFSSALSTIQQHESNNINAVLNGSVYVQNINCESLNVEIQKATDQITQVLIGHTEQVEADYNISPVTVSSEFLGLNLNIKKEDDLNQEVYTTEWLCNPDNLNNLQLKVSKNIKEKVQVPTSFQVKEKDQAVESKETKLLGKSTKRVKTRLSTLQDYKERLRKKAECMREKRKKLYEQESKEQRQQRLAKEAAKRREMRMYYETPEQRRKRLDAEAARKREYRMYNETPEEKRKRLDREAERRRIKRLSLYASETPEQRRERLNRESAKRREARLNQYAKESQEERQERLRKDALRVREMRFTRSAIETEEERRQRLVKDALRKREVRMHGGHSVKNNFTELQTVRNFEELNDVQIRENPDNQLGGHYLSNWMMWFQNTLTQPVHVEEQIVKPQQHNE